MSQTAFHRKDHWEPLWCGKRIHSRPQHTQKTCIDWMRHNRDPPSNKQLQTRCSKLENSFISRSSKWHNVQVTLRCRNRQSNVSTPGLWIFYHSESNHSLDWCHLPNLPYIAIWVYTLRKKGYRNSTPRSTIWLSVILWRKEWDVTLDVNSLFGAPVKECPFEKRVPFP